MSNIPEYLTKLRELNIEKSRLESSMTELQEINKQIAEITEKWQEECTHPAEYMMDEQCSACGYEFPKDEK